MAREPPRWLEYATPLPPPRGSLALLIVTLLAIGMLFLGMGMFTVRSWVNPPPATAPAPAPAPAPARAASPR